MIRSRTPRRRLLGTISAAALGWSALVAAPIAAVAAPSASHCPSQKTLARALTKNHREHLVRSKYNPNGVNSVTCSGNWATSGVAYNYGGEENAETALFHRTHGRWHEVQRDKPCAKHQVPKKIYYAACETS